MGDKTGISWTDATWNATKGCSRISAGCVHCYAEVQAARIVRMGKGKPTPYDNLVRVTAGGEPRWTGSVVLDTKALALPLRWTKPRRIFASSMSDMFHENLSNESIAAMFGVMAACPQHTFQVLTKRAKRMREWFEWLEATVRAGRGFECYAGSAQTVWCYVETNEILREHHVPSVVNTLWPLPNVWLGVSVENQEAADERIPDLLRTPAAVRFLSCEPLIGPVDLILRGSRIKTWDEDWKYDTLRGAEWASPHSEVEDGSSPSLDWIIAGCESGPGARPCSVEWLRSLRDQCARGGVAFFLKQAVDDRGDGDERCPECGEQIRWYVHGPGDSSASCACTVEGAEDANFHPPIGIGDESKRKPGNVIELPYLDGVQHAAFPEVERTIHG